MTEFSFSHELSIAKDDIPLHDREELSSHKLVAFYYLVRHARHNGRRLVESGGEALDEDMIRGICRILLNNDRTGIPRVIRNLGKPKHTITQKVAPVVEKTQGRLDELQDRLSPLLEEYLARIESVKEDKEKKRMETDLKLTDSDLPHLAGKAVTRPQLLEMYAARCMYDFKNKKLDKAGWRRLLGILIGREDKPVTAMPQFVIKFVDEPEDTDDKVTKEVRRVAPLLKDDLLYRIDAACKKCQGLGDLPTGLPRLLPREQQPPGTPIPPGYAKVGSAFSPADKRPVARPQSTISHAQPQSFTPSSRSAPYGSTLQPGYRNYGSAYGPPDIRPVTGGLSETSHSQVQIPNPGYGQNLSPDQLSANVPAQFQHTGRYEQETPVDREDPASSKDETSISSSGRSASPTQAETKRQEKDDKARRSTAKGDSKKVDEGAKKKSGDSRQKEADKAKDKAQKGRQSRP